MKEDKCSFCGREKNEVNLLIAGMEGHIVIVVSSRPHRY